MSYLTSFINNLRSKGNVEYGMKIKKKTKKKTTHYLKKVTKEGVEKY